MKKFLALLASFSLVATSTMTVVACGQTENKDNQGNDVIKLKEQLRTGLILKLIDSGVAKDLGIDVDSLWNDQTSSINKFINNYIDQQVTKLYTQDEVEKNFNERLKIQNANLNNKVQVGKKNFEEDALKEEPKYNEIFGEVDKLNRENSLITFLTDYTSSLNDKQTNAYDNDRKYGPLNPTFIDGERNDNNVAIYFHKAGDDQNKYIRWTSINDFEPENNPGDENLMDVSLGEYIPDQAMISSSEPDFILVENGKTLTLDKNSLGEGMKIIKEGLTGKEAMGYRFQNYLHKQDNANYEKTLVGQFIRGDMYRFAEAPTSNASKYEKAANQALFYKRDSAFVQNSQASWEIGTDGREDFKTNLKMVWTISLNDQDKITKANDLLLKNQDGDSERIANYSTYRQKLESFYTDENGANLNQDNKASNVLEILGLLAGLDGTDAAATTPQDSINRVNAINTSVKGVDPIFGIKGFQGFVDTSDGTLKNALGGESKIDVDSTAESKIAQVTGSSVIKNKIDTSGANSYDFTFENANKNLNTTRDLIVVLPVYLIDLLKTVGQIPTADENQNTDPNKLVDIVTGQWVELLPQVEKATWTSGSRIDPSKNTDWTDLSNQNDDVVPTANSFKNVAVGPSDDKKTYIYIADNQNVKPLTVQGATGDDVAINFEFTNKENDWAWEHNYGIEGVGSNDKTPMATNGQKVKFGIHLGEDSNLSDNIAKAWARNDGNARLKRSDDLAYYLTADKKAELINILTYIVTKQDEGKDSFTSTAKSNIYSRYINKEDILYNPLKDSIGRYIEKDEDEDSD